MDPEIQAAREEFATAVQKYLSITKEHTLKRYQAKLVETGRVYMRPSLGTHSGVPVGVDERDTELRSMYLELSKKYHPDRNPDTDTTADFQQIQELYEDGDLDGLKSFVSASTPNPDPFIGALRDIFNVHIFDAVPALEKCYSTYITKDELLDWANFERKYATSKVAKEDRDLLDEIIKHPERWRRL